MSKQPTPMVTVVSTAKHSVNIRWTNPHNNEYATYILDGVTDALSLPQFPTGNPGMSGILIEY